MTDTFATRLQSALRIPLSTTSTVAIASSLVLGGLLFRLYSKASMLDEATRARIWEATRFKAPTESIQKSMDKPSVTITLSDGRKLCYIEYGTPMGKPIFGLHGLPGSRVDYEFWDDIATKHGARLISVDRPGIGRSSPHPGRSLTDHARDIKQLADQLEIDTFGIVGISGGAPYALACAFVLPPSKLRAVSLVCGLGPRDIGYWGMGITNYVGLTFVFPLWPWLIKAWASRQPLGRLDLDDEVRSDMMVAEFLKSSSPSGKDVNVWMDHSYMLRQGLRSTRESFAQGHVSIIEDGRLMARRWDFNVEDIRKDLPFQLWYGSQDQNVPVNHGVQLKKRLGSNATLLIKDETHASLEVNFKEEQLVALLTSMN